MLNQEPSEIPERLPEAEPSAELPQLEHVFYDPLTPVPEEERQALLAKFQPIVEQLVPERTFDAGVISRIASLDPMQHQTLHDFFKIAFVHDPLGYVVFFDKPVLMMDVHQAYSRPINSFVIDAQWEEHLVKALDIMARNFPETAERFMIRSREYESAFLQPVGSIARETLFINKAHFREAFRANADIFEGIYGQGTTADALLKLLTESPECFLEVLQGREDAMGILLGFGRDNALTYEYREKLGEEAGRDPAKFREYAELRAREHHLFERPRLQEIEELVQAARDTMYPGYVIWDDALTLHALEVKVASQNVAIQYIWSSPDFMERVLEAMQPLPTAADA